MNGALSATPDAAAQLDLAISTAEAVERILSCTEPVVAAITSRTEQQVREVAVEVEARAAREAVERRDQLIGLRHELADRASSLATHYEEVIDRLEAVEAVLAQHMNMPFSKEKPSADSDPRVRAIKMTLRERQRVSFAYEQDEESLVPSEQAPAVGRPPWVEHSPAVKQEPAAPAPAIGQAPATSQPPPSSKSSAEPLSQPPSQPASPLRARSQRRRWWHRWQREAA